MPLCMRYRHNLVALILLALLLLILSAPAHG
jgi:hypothetical protein